MDTGRVVPADGRERARAIGDGRGQADRRARTPRPQRGHDGDEDDGLPAVDEIHRVDLFA